MDWCVCYRVLHVATRKFYRHQEALQKHGNDFLHVKYMCFVQQYSNMKNNVKLPYCKGSTPETSNSNQSFGMALCKPINSWIFVHIYAYKKGCGFHAQADTKVGKLCSTITKVGVAHKELVRYLCAFIFMHIRFRLG